MNKCAIVFFPQQNVEEIQRFRIKFDPKSNLIAPHITLVFPFPETENSQIFIEEMSKKISKLNSFPIVLRGVKFDTDDNFLHFLVDEGKEKITDIHDDLYSGILESYWRKDLPYNPHMTIGVFSNSANEFDEEKYSSAQGELELFESPIALNFNNLNVIEISDSSMPRTILKRFSF